MTFKVDCCATSKIGLVASKQASGICTPKSPIYIFLCIYNMIELNVIDSFVEYKFFERLKIVCCLTFSYFLIEFWLLPHIYSLPQPFLLSHLGSNSKEAQVETSTIVINITAFYCYANRNLSIFRLYRFNFVQCTEKTKNFTLHCLKRLIEILEVGSIYQVSNIYVIHENFGIVVLSFSYW